MSVVEDEDDLLRSVALRNATSILLARERADEERRQAQDAQRNSEASVRAILNQAGVGIAVAALDGHFLDMNQKFVDLLGYAPDELRRLTVSSITHVDDREATSMSVSQLIARAIPEYSLEKRYVRKDGSTLWTLTTVTLLKDPAGGPDRFVGVVEDIGPRKRVEAALRVATQADEKQAKDTLLAHLSHELRTPVAAIDWFTTNLREGLLGEMTGGQREHLDTIATNVKQLERMIGDFLEATRAETGKLTVALRQVTVEPLVRDAVVDCDARASAAQLALHAIIPATLPRMWADPERTLQVLANLVNNAITFTPPGGAITVDVALDDEPEMIRFSVTDTGRGITAENRERVFERMFQEQPAPGASRQGLGLGLFIARELVGLQGGRIWVASNPMHGATISFTLPAFSLRYMCAPILTARHLAAGTLSVITFTPASSGEKDEEATERMRRTRALLSGSIFAGQDLLVPYLFAPAASHPWFIVADADHAGAAAIVHRIRQRMAGDRFWRQAGALPALSISVIDYPTPARVGLEASVTYVVNRLTALMTAA